MLNNSIAILAATPPPAKKKLSEMADLNGRIAVLENKLGLAHRLPTLNSQRAQARLTELESMQAQRAIPAQISKVAAEHPFEPSGSAVVDSAIKAGGSRSLKEHQLKQRRAALAETVANAKPGNLQHQAATQKLAEIESEIENLK